MEGLALLVGAIAVAFVCQAWLFGARSKAHTILMRISAFDRTLRSIDSSAVIEYA